MKRRRVARWVAVAAAAWLTSAAMAQTVYRCGPDGRSYSQQPCADGRSLEAADPRSDEQRASAEAVAQRERQLADGLEQDRLAREAAANKTAAARIGPPPAKAAQASSTKRNTSKNKLAAARSAHGHFTVIDPTAPRKPPRRQRERAH